MTLTTEQIEQVIDDCRKGAAMRGLFNKWIVEEIASELLRCRDRIAELSAVASLEAQPVGFRYRHMDTASWLYNDWCWPDSVEAEQCQIEWLYTAQPAPANANPVAWEMRYWNSGHNCWHDWERITAEQHAEMSAEHAMDNDYEFRVLYDAPTAPAVPDESDPRDAFESVFPMPKYVVRCGTGYAVTAYSAWGAHDFKERWEGWNACRAAMMAQPVSSGYKLPDNVREALTLALQAMEFMGDTLNNIDAVCTEDVEYVTPAFNAVRELLAAAPEGGNG